MPMLGKSAVQMLGLPRQSTADVRLAVGVRLTEKLLGQVTESLDLSWISQS